MGQVVGQTAVLQGDAGVDEGGPAAVVVHEEVLGDRGTTLCMDGLCVSLTRPLCGKASDGNSVGRV